MIQGDFLSPSENNIKNSSIIISFDLEDFTFDILRNLGKETRTNFSALDKCYELISTFSRDHLDGSRFTFFTTGTLAKEYPDLLKQISNDGHEISSHYHFHDLMFLQTEKEIEKNFDLSKEAIFRACGKYPLGFRAPAFSIKPFNWKIFKLISKHFKYDSSFVLHQEDIPKFNKESYSIFQNGFHEFPIVTKKIFGNFNLKSGGTFFRLFPLKVINSVINHNLKNNFIPQIYLHPYDLLSKREFMVDYKSFISSNNVFPVSTIKYLRQHQWLSLNNKSSYSKLVSISSSYKHMGTYSELI